MLAKVNSQVRETEADPRGRRVMLYMLNPVLPSTIFAGLNLSPSSSLEPLSRPWKFISHSKAVSLQKALHASTLRGAGLHIADIDPSGLFYSWTTANKDSQYDEL